MANIARALNESERNTLLDSLKMSVGEWGQITDCLSNAGNNAWVSYKRPVESFELLVFSSYVYGWIPEGDWKILQIDNSNYMDISQWHIISCLLGLPIDEVSRSKTFVITTECAPSELGKLSAFYIVYWFLLFGGHCYLTSSRSDKGQILGVQDGYAYLYERGKSRMEADMLMSGFENNRRELHSSIADIIIKNQEYSLG